VRAKGVKREKDGRQAAGVQVLSRPDPSGTRDPLREGLGIAAPDEITERVPDDRAGRRGGHHGRQGHARAGRQDAAGDDDELAGNDDAEHQRRLRARSEEGRARCERRRYRTQ
jgi:hypothetical protein